MSSVRMQGNIGGTGVITVSSPNTNSDRTINLPDASGTVQVSGSPISGTTGTFTGLVDISAAGAGQIQFPATQSASANANTLDDYEEGTWTPQLRDAATDRSPTYSSGPSGTYTKIGRFVFIRWGMLLSNKGAGSGSGEVRIYGMPFAPAATGAYQEPNISMSTGALNTADNAFRIRMVASTGAYLFGRVSNNSDTVWTYANLSNSSWLIGQMCYEV